MSISELYLVDYPLTFYGSPSRRDAKFNIIGVPFDSTSSYRSGQRFAPRALREASLNIEGNGYAVGGSIDDVSISDLGDVAVIHGDVSSTLERVAIVVKEVASRGSIPVLVGGEHTITLGALRGLLRAGVRPCLLVLDAHFDLRSEYLGFRFSHATVMRRVTEEVGVKIFYVGVRAYDNEEVAIAEGMAGIGYITAWNFDVLGVKGVVAKARSFLGECDSIYISIDMDVYDPAYAPGVANPEPGGLPPGKVLPLIAHLAADERVVGLDLVEVAPPHDCGDITSILAAKTLQQALIAASSRVAGGGGF
ncbi:MAG: agmatinase [Desulfurococcales archaeon]|nr:agmatinase [Desulfurococcales archaeon]